MRKELYFDKTDTVNKASKRYTRFVANSTNIADYVTEHLDKFLT
jgi:hypothetical protein